MLGVYLRLPFSSNPLHSGIRFLPIVLPLKTPPFQTKGPRRTQATQTPLNLKPITGHNVIFDIFTDRKGDNL